MSSKYQADSPKQAQPGDILLVVHEFGARSPDELSLSKGDRIELIERDDDFGDGWYLGRHLSNGNTGLFPEVYTTTAPRNLITMPNRPKAPNLKPTSPPATSKFGPVAGSEDKTPPAIDSNATSYFAATNNTTSNAGPAIISTPPASSESQFRSPNQPASPAASPFEQGTGNAYSSKTPPQTSAVMNETLSVIDEHITNMNRPSHLEPMSSIAERRPSSHDSGSHYSASTSQIGLPLTNTSENEDEDDVGGLTEQEVSQWSPDRVAEYLEGLGVEKPHCDLFRTEEFTGEVLLQMDQSQIFMKELDLGPIGRRMRTWQKIKALQDEVRASSAMSGHPLQSNGSQSQRVRAPYNSGSSSPRPSAASVRSLGQRRHSSTDQAAATGVRSSDPRSSSRTKQSSFDRGWTMNDASPGSAGLVPTSYPYNGTSRSNSSNHNYTLSADRSPYGKPSRGSSQISLGTPTEMDKGYVSGGEGDAKRTRNVLRKRDGQSREAFPDHARAPSYGSDKRRSAGFFWNKKSGESPVTPAESYDQMTVRHSDGVRIVSEPLQANQTSPTVTRLEYDDASKYSPDESKRASTASASEKQSAIRTRGFRTISDAITGREKSLVTSTDKLITGESSFTQSPDGTSASPSVITPTHDLEEANKSEFSTPAVGNLSSGTKKKTKKATSAYVRGLEKKTPQEQMVGCEYSGWMKKKSSNIMTTWKPRLFVLRGRRLSYYYSETDTEEKGLIDISNHRVLPADGDFLTSMHAAITGATAATPTAAGSDPNTPHTPNQENGANGTAAAPPVSAMIPSLSPSQRSSVNMTNALAKMEDPANQAFLFKLVPPRSGLSKGVNFTKPSVHYFAVPSRKEGRLWMAALMKATIDRDETMSVITTYQQKTISLEQARARKERPPFLMGVGEEEEDTTAVPAATAATAADTADTAAGAGATSITPPTTITTTSTTTTNPIEPPSPAKSTATGVQEERGNGVYEPTVTTNEIFENMFDQVQGVAPGTNSMEPVQAAPPGLGIQGLNNGNPIQNGGTRT